MSELKEKSRLSMSLKMKSKDSVGTSQIEGILLYKYDYLAIYFFKSYDDKKNSGQTGPYQWLAYEGVQQGEMFRGSWYYEGFQGSGSYSGVWEMMHNWKYSIMIKFYSWGFWLKGDVRRYNLKRQKNKNKRCKNEALLSKFIIFPTKKQLQ